jgi:hypothetical protein
MYVCMYVCMYVHVYCTRSSYPYCVRRCTYILTYIHTYIKDVRVKTFRCSHCSAMHTCVNRQTRSCGKLAGQFVTEAINMCMLIYIYIYIYIYTSICICICTCICIFLMYIHEYKYIHTPCVPSKVHSYICECKYTHACIHINSHVVCSRSARYS